MKKKKSIIYNIYISIFGFVIRFSNFTSSLLLTEVSVPSSPLITILIKL